ncbi:MAG: HD domain-containing protein [Paracoccus sp. (in: a-proteobacteria)]|uniref:HD domain-containing protein n=1 Tax=Paracoccus sp. TaxID=267 RepID=UPI0026DFB23E|nr:HD domain-containing protein [Paracoccus sp. (in: a-proteobacteria)]MDO5622454.1 HD domain-containing protein [Paracoccus sp. (in: a-proteobacteria)]
MGELAAQFAFLAEADRLKSVERANVLMDLSRRENTAEHCWHVALYAMVFGASDRAIAMLLLHDLVEIDAGDQPIYLDHDAAALQAAENAAADRLFGMLPGGDALAALWREFEAGLSEDAAMAKRMDHVQPLFQVVDAPAPLPDHLEIARQMMRAGRIARFREEWPEVIAAAEARLNSGTRAGDLAARLAFLAEADRLKTVMRASVIHSGRRENSAEHSWHLALYALVLAGQAGPGVDIGRVIRMLLLHDLVEIDTGDVPIHAQNGAAHHSDDQLAAEAAAADRIFGLLPPATGAAFRTLWDEFEANQTPDARFAKSLDRAQPVWLNICAEGGTWAEYGVTWAQLVDRAGVRIASGAPGVWDWLAARAHGYFEGR